MDNAVSKHTPGPWTIGRDGIGRPAVIYGGETSDPREILAGIMTRPDGDRCHADARLIAAAPDMFEALKNTLSLLKCFTRESDDVAKAVWDQAEAALAKAQTES